jgi:hypothetical protein
MQKEQVMSVIAQKLLLKLLPLATQLVTLDEIFKFRGVEYTCFDELQHTRFVFRGIIASSKTAKCKSKNALGNRVPPFNAVGRATQRKD